MGKYCVNCKHLLRKEADGPRFNVWYNLLCRKAPREVAVDPVTGEAGFEAVNSLG